MLYSDYHKIVLFLSEDSSVSLKEKDIYTIFAWGGSYMSCVLTVMHEGSDSGC
jgi:hypothetical protein